MTGTTCTGCGRVGFQEGRWCGTCGAALPEPSVEDRADGASAGHARDADDGGRADDDRDVGRGDGAEDGSPRVRVTAPHAMGRTNRRDALRTAAMAAVAAFLGAGIGWFARGGDDTWVDVGDVDDLLQTIDRDGAALLPGLTEPASHAVVRWDPARIRDEDGLRAADVYDGEPVLDPRTGLMVLVLRSPHGGCETPLCHSSGWFEDPCFGSKFNAWGEWVGGPASRGLDRRPSRVAGGRLQVHQVGFTIGTDRQARMLDQDPQGPNCVDL